MVRFSFTVDGFQQFDRAFNRIDEYISDFRSVWPSVAKAFYEIEREQFASEGAHGASGKWPALSPAYKRWKDVHFPGMGILKATTELFESLTSMEALNAVFRVGPDELTIGSSAPYGTAHQRGTGRMPARPPISMNDADKIKIQKAIQSELVKFTRRMGFQVQEKAA